MSSRRSSRLRIFPLEVYMMKQNRYLALTLAGLLSVGLLSGCGSKNNDSDTLTESPSPTPVQESPAVETGTESEAYTAAMVLSVDGSQLTLQLYIPAEEGAAQGIADPADFDLANYVLSQDTMLVAVDDESVLRAPDSADGSSLMLADLKPGTILLVQQNADDGSLTDVVVQNAGEVSADKLAQVTANSETGLEVAWYQSDDPESVVTSYTNVNLDLYALSTESQALAADDSTPVYRLEDGVLVQATLSDLSVGDTLVVSLSADDAPVQIVAIQGGEATGSV